MTDKVYRVYFANDATNEKSFDITADEAKRLKAALKAGENFISIHGNIYRSFSIDRVVRKYGDETD